MKNISLTLNGKAAAGRAGLTILELARQEAVEIPTLCYMDKLTPIGACRLCVVEVEGSRTLVGACHTPIQEGMVIQTHSPKVQKSRQVILELLLSSHSGDCLICSNANTCELRKFSAEAGVAVSRFRSKKRYYPQEDACPWMFRDLSRCILCYRCIWACRQLAKKNLLSMGYRGFEDKVISDTDTPLCKEACKSCDECIKVCPVGALRKPENKFRKRKLKPLVIK